MAYNHGTHRTQFDGSPLASENCVPTSLANGARELTQGAIDVSGGYVRSLVKRSEEQNPNTPGWSLQDASLAANRMNIAFTVASGTIDTVHGLVARGYAILLPGDSDQFGNNTCSGAFNGDHMTCLHPDVAMTDTRILLADPICRVRRWEQLSVIKSYAQKYAGSTTLQFGVLGGNDVAVSFNTERHRVRDGALFYESPNGPRIGSFGSSVLITTLGPSLTKTDPDGIDYAWRLALVTSGAVTGEIGRKWVWVRRVDLTPQPTSPEWDLSIERLLLNPDGRYPSPPAPPDPAAIKAARTEGFTDAKQQAVTTSTLATDKIKTMKETL